MTDCVFCHKEKLAVVAENKLALAFYDGCPVSKGHILVIPKHHVANYFDASFEEHNAMSRLIFEVKQYIDKKYNPDGYNIGANIGHCAGQTVFHFHIHIIPRYEGDVEDPRGGVRKVIPSRNHHLTCNKKDLHQA